jgi:hypothetical protein
MLEKCIVGTKVVGVAFAAPPHSKAWWLKAGAWVDTSTEAPPTAKAIIIAVQYEPDIVPGAVLSSQSQVVSKNVVPADPWPVPPPLTAHTSLPDVAADLTTNWPPLIG